jgi:hypothetical protein
MPMPFKATLGETLAAMAQIAYNYSTLIENRGLHWTDKRYSQLTGIEFVGNHPICSLDQIHNDLAAQTHALEARKGQNKITPAEYRRNLRVRCIRGQLLNPALRKDRFFQIHGERLRRACLNPHARRFLNMAQDVSNINFVKTFALIG